MKCEVCSINPAEKQCNQCGRRVCSKDYEVEKGICRICNEALCKLCNEHLAITTCPICARPICAYCSRQVTVAIRICRECYMEYNKPKVWPPPRLVKQAERVYKELSSLTLSFIHGSIRFKSRYKV